MTSCSARSLERRKEFGLSVFEAKYLSEALATSYALLCSPRQNTHLFAQMSRQVSHLVSLACLGLSTRFSWSWWFVHKSHFLASRLLSVLPSHSTQLRSLAIQKLDQQSQTTQLPSWESRPFADYFVGLTTQMTSYFGICCV